MANVILLVLIVIVAAADVLLGWVCGHEGNGRPLEGAEDITDRLMCEEIRERVGEAWG